MKWVSLSCDEKATYAAHLPVVTRLWDLLGYHPLIAIHDGNWDTAFGRTVLRHTVGNIRRVPQVPPLSVANTMRAERLFAFTCPEVQPDDFILMADVDMYPLSRTFFNVEGPLTILRALWYAWLGHGGRAPELTGDWLQPGSYNFPMCYAGASARVWSEMFPEERLSACTRPTDYASSVGFDEAQMSYRMLWRVERDPIIEVQRGVWTKGEMKLIDPIDAPLLSSYPDMPRGLMRLGDMWRPGKGPMPEGALDIIPPRFVRHEYPWWVFDAVCMYFPELTPWLKEYQRELASTLRGALWP